MSDSGPQTLIIAGEPGAREKRIRMMWSRTNGHSYSRIWWGPYDAVRSITLGKSAALSGAESWELIQVEGSPIGILTVNYSGLPSGGGQGNNDASEVVSIAFTNETFPINQSPTFIDIETSVITDLESKLSTHDDNPYSETTSKEYRYYDLRSKKIDNYEVDLPYVTWTRTVPANYPTALDLANVGAIFSTGNLAGSIGAPILFTIPTGNVGVKVDDAGKFSAGWKKGGSVDFMADGKAQLVLTARYGLWANDLYTFIS